MFVVAGSLPRSAFVPIGPEFYPRVVLGLTAVLSGALALHGLLAGRRPRPAARAGPGANYTLVVAAFALFGLYVLALQPLGYRIATFLFVALLQAAIDPPRSLRRLAVVLAVALGTSALTYIVFEKYLSVLLPRGTWTGW